MNPAEVILSYTMMVIILLSLTTFSVVVVIKMRREKNALENEMLRARLEEKESTLNNISREIHDNFGQQLNLLYMTLRMTRNPKVRDKDDMSDFAEELVSRLIEATNNYNRSLNSDLLRESSLYDGIVREAERINQLKQAKCRVLVTGTRRAVPVETRFMLLRIVQESMGNALKHADADNITVRLGFQPDSLMLSIEDDGTGFDPMAVNGQGMGLENMRFRANEIGAAFALESEIGRGTSIMLRI